MLAARWHGRLDVRVEEIPDLGKPRPGWVRVQVAACGICGTDVEEYTSGPIMIPVPPNRSRLTGACAPLTMGHEAVGIVEEVSDGVKLEVGTPVAIETNVFCGTCAWCRQGEYQLCPDLASLGLMGDGGLAEEILAPAYMCIPYGDHLAPKVAAFAEPLSVAVRALRRGGVTAGKTVGIVGAGTIGLLALQAARIAGARRVVVAERHPRRLEIAKLFGADVVLPEEAHDAAFDLTEGIGLDVTLESAGNASAASLAINMARRGGRTVLLGVFNDVVPLPMMDFLLNEREVVASLSHVYNVDYTAAVDLLSSGAIDPRPLITDCIPLRDVVTQGLEKLAANPADHLKIMVLPTA